MIRLADPSSGHDRCVFEGLCAGGIGVQLHYTLLCLQAYYDRLSFREGKSLKSEAYASSAINLSSSPCVQYVSQHNVVRTLASLLEA